MLMRLTRWHGSFVLCALFLGLTALLPSAQLQNLSVPASAVRGSTITVGFQLKGPTWGTAHYAIALSEPGTFNCNGVNVWVADEKGVFGPSQVGLPAASACADYIGPQSSGAVGGIASSQNQATPAWTSHSVVVQIPADAPDNIQVNVVATDYGVQATRSTCQVGASLGQALSLSGTRAGSRMDFEAFQAGGIEASKYKLGGRVSNWGTWPVRLNELCLSYWFYDVYDNWDKQTFSNNQTIFNASNQGYLSNVGQVSATVEAWPAADCGNGRKANHRIRVCFGASPADQVIPGCGGYMATADGGNSLAIVNRHDWADIDYSDDYSRQSDAGVNNAGRADTAYVQLSQGGAAACEQKAGQQDPIAGQAPCEQGACSITTLTRTTTPSASATRTRTSSPVATVTLSATPSYSPTQSLTMTPSLSTTATSTTTVTPTSTVSPTLTPIAADCDIVVESARRADLGPGQGGAVLRFFNGRSYAQNLKNLEWEYWIKAPKLDADIVVDSVTLQPGAVDASLAVGAALRSVCAGGQRALIFGWFRSQLLQPGQTLELSFHYSLPEHSLTTDQLADYSLPLSADFGPAGNLPVFCHGFPLQGRRPPGGLGGDPSAWDFRCVLWEVQRRLEGIRTAECDVHFTASYSPDPGPVPPLENELTEPSTLHMILQAPDLVRTLSQASTRSDLMEKIRGREHLRFSLGSTVKDLPLEACQPNPKFEDWMLPKQVSRPFDYFSLLSFDYVSGPDLNGVVVWTCTSQIFKKITLTIDTNEFVIRNAEFSTGASWDRKQFIENIDYQYHEGSPYIVGYRLRLSVPSTSGPNRESIVDYNIDYQSVGKVLPEGTFE